MSAHRTHLLVCRMSVTICYALIPKIVAQAQSFHDETISGSILTVQIRQVTSSLPDQFEQATTGMLIVFVDLEMFDQFVDSSSQQRDLNLWGSCIARVNAVLSYDFFLLFFSKRHSDLLGTQ
jgi:hypothetical protein